MEPFSISDVPWRTFRRGEAYGMQYQDLSEQAGATQISVSHEILAPGQIATGFHYHMLNEEHVLVLEGQLTLRLGDACFQMKAGSYVCFPAGRKLGHALHNESSAPCKYLAIGQPHHADVVVFPDDDKVTVKLLGEAFSPSSRVQAWNDFLTMAGTPSPKPD
jgi:uncharacterized cupin superfamily protein